MQRCPGKCENDYYLCVLLQRATAAAGTAATAAADAAITAAADTTAAAARVKKCQRSGESSWSAD